jgi:uncharacterized protein (TIGR02145 family)
MKKEVQQAQFGMQIWMKEDLDVCHFRNGDPIPFARATMDFENAGKLGKPAFCIVQSGKEVNFFYNWFAINDPRRLAPEGWHVSTRSDWEDLLSGLGGGKKAGDRLKKEKFVAAAPGLVQSGTLMSAGAMCSWWTPEETGGDDALAAFTPFVTGNEVRLNGLSKSYGMQVRCVSDDEAQYPGPRHAFGTMTDQEGNRYRTIAIGTQTWMAENLRATKYNDGAEIPNEKSNSRWETLSTPAYTWYWDDRDAHRKTDGALYNFFAVETGKLCPSGWHVPTKADWDMLGVFLGEQAGGKMKIAGTGYWSAPNEGGTNESGFCALPSGCCTDAFSGLGTSTYYWSSTPDTDRDAFRGFLTWTSAKFQCTSYKKVHGNSVRCIRND